MKKRFDEIEYFQKMLEKQRRRYLTVNLEDGYDDLIAELLLSILARLHSISTFICILTGFLISTLLAILFKLG